MQTNIETERSKQRGEEDNEFTSVIIKRTDEVVRHPDDVLENAILEGLEQIQRPIISLILSSIAAGLILGFTVMAVAVVTQATQSVSNPWLQRIYVATVYPLGFVICILSGTQLFTEHTALAVYPVLDKKVKPILLLRHWFFVISGNLVGAFISAGLLTWADEVIQAKEGYIIVAEHFMVFDREPLFISAVLAGWLMAQGAWLVLSSKSTIAQISCVYIVTFLIGMEGFIIPLRVRLK